MRRTDQQGFTLIEVLVAFTIAVVLLVPLLHSFSTGLGGIGRADRYNDALVVARSTYEALAPSAGSGGVMQVGLYQVSTRVHPDRVDGPALPMVPFDVAVTVTWRDGARRRSIALHGIRLGPAPVEEAAP